MPWTRTTNDADQLLGAYLSAKTEPEAQELLGQLISVDALPVIRRAVGQRLGSDADAEDVHGYTVVKLVSLLKDHRSQPRERSIEDFHGYVAVVAYNACHDYLRRKYPERHKLKDRLRHTLTRSSALAIWEHSNGRWLCGKREWRNDQVIALVHPREISHRLSEETGADLFRLSEADLVERIIQLIRSPLRFDDLVDTIAEIRGIRDERHAEVDDLASSIATPVDEKLSLREFVTKLWVEIRELPCRQRVALLLSFRDHKGSSATALLLTIGVAGIREIAATLEMPAEELAGIWNNLPFDDAAIALRLETTRQQVINLRNSARDRLARRMKKVDAIG